MAKNDVRITRRLVDVDQLARLRDLLGFLNLDLARATADRRRGFALRLAIMLGFTELKDDRSVEPKSSFLELLAGGEGENLMAVQESVNQCLNEVVAKIQQLRAGQRGLETKWRRKEDSVRLKSLFSLHTDVELTLGLNVEEETRNPENWELDQVVESRWKTGELDKARFRTLVTASVTHKALIYHLLQSLNGLPVSSLKRCIECQGWFVQETKRVRQFCSKSCAKKKTNRELYERMKQNPDLHEAVLEKSRERARKSYEKRAKEKNPNAKIPRRPRSRKEKEV
jgi:hypothetical protein